MAKNKNTVNQEFEVLLPVSWERGFQGSRIQGAEGG